MRNLLLNLLFLIPLFAVSQVPSYYDDVDLNLSGTALKDELSIKVISTHTNFLVYTPDVWDALRLTDLDPTDNTKVLLIYGYDDADGDSKTDRTRGVNDNGGAVGDWNREHVYSRSLGIPDLGTSGPGSDAHHLRSCDTQWNSTRNNRKFTDGSGDAGIIGAFWYPGDEWKGDVARMMMYMYLRYGSQCLPINVGNGTALTVDSNMIDLFLQWNVDDPVSALENQRNPILEGLQGNRNPFIDNPAFATEIWGGTQAEDLFNLPPDTQNPTAPTALISSNVSSNALTLSWNASTDNVAVTDYEIYQDGSLIGSSSSVVYNVSGLIPNTTYAFVIYAKDAAGNISTASNAETITTLFPDITAPSAPTGLISSNITSTSLTLNWLASTDDIAVVDYDVYQDGVLIATTSNLTYDVSGLITDTVYTYNVYAKDASGNISTVSNTEAVTTLTGSSTISSELFFSEYVEGSSFNKSVEIANFTGASVDLSIYSLKVDTNGGGNWGTTYPLSGIVVDQDVAVIAHSSSVQSILDEADLTTAAAALIFNGNDPVGLFKNDVLIDIIGTFSGGTTNFAINRTLRRKSSVSEPNTLYDTLEWDTYTSDTFDGLGSHSIDGSGVTDTEAPTAVVNIAITNQSETTLDISWDASSDNVAVTEYDVYINGVINQTIALTSTQITGLTLVTSYAITIFAKDAAGNISEVSAITTGTTIDTTPPSSPASLISSNITSASLTLSWFPSTDNIAVVGYDVYQDGVLIITTSDLTYNISGLISNTTYAYTVYGKDAEGNISTVSNTETATTLTGSSIISSELFFSEYVEGSSFNKSVEIANFTGTPVDLSIYSLKRDTNGGGTWGTAYTLSGTIVDQDVVVIAHSSSVQSILDEADLTSSASALIFNGNDPVGLFKNDVLIDVIGTFAGGTANFAINTTLRRKSSVSEPNTLYDTLEWNTYTSDTFDGLGSHLIDGSGVADTEAPTAVVNIAVTNQLETTLDLSWDASSDNVAVTEYDIYLDGVINQTITSTITQITGLTVLTSYAITVYAKDAAGNVSTVSATTTATTIDTIAPTAPTSLVSASLTEIAFDLSWSESSDNVEVTNYNIYQDGLFIGSTSGLNYSVSGLTPNTTYEYNVEAVDITGNYSPLSTSLNVTTLDNMPTSIILHEGFFESGWNSWVDGGNDCNRYNGSRSYEGNYSIRLRDNSGTASSMTSEVFDLTSFNNVEFNFYFYSYSMETNENFIVQYYDGSTWITVANYVQGTDFTNNSFYSIALILDNTSYTFTANSQFRIQCDASGNGDHIYIDEISIIGNGVSTTSKKVSSKTNIEFISYKDTSSESANIEEIRLYPNPVLGSILNVDIDSDFVSYNIFNSLGQLVKKGELNNRKLQLGDLQSGIYVLHLSDGESTVYEKFVKK